MKKISLFFVTAILMIAFTACNGAKKTEAPAEQPVKTDTATQVVTAEPAPAPVSDPAEMLKNFQAYAKEYGEAFNNLTKDPKKFTDLSKLSQQKVAEMEQIKNQLNAKQSQDYKKALDIVIKVNNGGK